MVEEELSNEIKKIKTTKSIKIFETEETEGMDKMIKLTNGKILLVSNEKTVKVLNPQNDFHEDFTGKINN